MSNLAATLTELNQFDAARRVLADARTAKLNHIALQRAASVLALIDNDTAAMQRELEAALARPEGPSATNWQPRKSAFGGRIRQAHEEFRTSVVATSAAGLAQTSGLYSAQDAVSHAVVGQCAEAVSEATAATGVSRDPSPSNSRVALAWCGADTGASALSDELAQRFPDAVLTTRLHVPVIAAATAVRAGQPARALELLDAVRRFNRSPVAEFWPAFVRAEAQLQLGHHADAAGEFGSIARTPG